MRARLPKDVPQRVPRQRHVRSCLLLTPTLFPSSIHFHLSPSSIHFPLHSFSPSLLVRVNLSHRSKAWRAVASTFLFISWPSARLPSRPARESSHGRPIEDAGIVRQGCNQKRSRGGILFRRERSHRIHCWRGLGCWQTRRASLAAYDDIHRV